MVSYFQVFVASVEIHINPVFDHSLQQRGFRSGILGIDRFFFGLSQS